MSGGRRDPHHAGPHARRLQLDQWHDLQSRPARRSRQLGAARQPRLGLCRYAALLPAAPNGASASGGSRRRWPRQRGRRHPDHRHGLDPPDLRGLHQGRDGHGDPALHRTTTAATRPASAISSAPSSRLAASRPRGSSCSRRRRRAGWRSAPMPAPAACCSTASAPSACAMSTIATGAPARGCRRGAR